MMVSRTAAVEEEGRLKSYHFCSDDHLSQFTERKGMSLSKD